MNHMDLTWISLALDLVVLWSMLLLRNPVRMENGTSPEILSPLKQGQMCYNCLKNIENLRQHKQKPKMIELDFISPFPPPHP